MDDGEGEELGDLLLCDFRNVYRFASRTGADHFFNDPAAKFLSEAWVASKIATARQADQVMLVPESERWPDFRLRWGKTVWQYEITTADKEGRRVGQEHKFDKPPAPHAASRIETFMCSAPTHRTAYLRRIPTSRVNICKTER
jgi:hypothetical protein